MEKRMNKKAEEGILMENIIFFIIVAVFFAAMFLFVARAGSQATVVEQIYAKQIAITIDKIRPGTIVELDISKLYEVAEKNDFTGDLINISNEDNKIQVKLVQGKGYEFMFFNNKDIVWDIKRDKFGSRLILEVKNE